MDVVQQVLSGLFLFAGCFFFLTGSIGLLRMPDLFTRMHAASVADTVGGSLLLIGMIIHAGVSLVSAKLLMLLLIFLFIGPVASHALARAARYAGIEPLLDKAKRK